MKTSEFDYNLPYELIAQHPVSPKDQSRLMILDRKAQKIKHDYFYNLDKYLNSNDVLVFNQSKVIPARLIGKKDTGGKIEILLLKNLVDKKWECLTSPQGKISQNIYFGEKLKGKIIDNLTIGVRVIEFNLAGKEFTKILEKTGSMPTPPYIKEKLKNNEEYQTIFARTPGSVAAPTAGFHFTSKLIEKLHQQKIKTEFLTLHVGLGTFQPVKTENIENHFMHSEWFEISNKLANNLNRYKREGRKIISVGTTSTRSLESSTQYAEGNHELQPFTGETSLFITPGYQFKFVDKIITNFHLPKSTLLMLVSAFAGKEFILKAYQEAIKEKYRFYSFGDGMLII